MEFDSSRRELVWLQLPGGQFLEPFFEDTRRQIRRNAAPLRTPLEALRETNPDVPEPSAVFFHSSRCGSTLVSQLLARVPGCRTISEPPIFDLLLNHDEVDDTIISGLLRAFGKPSEDHPPRLFLKTDCWHLPQLGRLKRLFPQTPFYFIYREPEAILQSHRRARGSQMVPGLVDYKHFGIDPATVNHADLDGYAERVLSSIFKQGVEAVESGHASPIAYSQLPQLLWEKLGPAFGIPEGAWEEAKKRLHIHAKRPQLQHEPETDIPPIPLPEDLAANFAKLELLRAAAY